MRKSLAAIVGFSAFVLPESAPWSLFLTLIAAPLYIGEAADRATLLLRVAVAGSFVMAVVGMLVPAPLATAILIACSLGKTNPLLAVSILGLQTSYVASLEALLVNYLHPFQLETAGPSVIAGLVALAIQPGRRWWKFTLPALSALVALACQRFPLGPDTLATLAALPTLLLSATATQGEYSARQRSVGITASALLLVAGCAAWFVTPPRSTAERYVILPSAGGAPEAKFYESYVDASKYAGLSLRNPSALEAIPKGSLLLLPWLTSSLETKADDTLLPTIRELARSRGWTVVLVGEHTNMTGVADRVASLLGFPALRNDLTTPPGNTDDSGPLRSGDFRAWPHNSIFNRGASVEIKSIFDKVLLSGDGWWAEPDIGEWLWVGDYQWQPSDRHGRLTLAASFEDGGARWIVVGDTSAFVNRQLIADPRATERIIEMASLWPQFLRDLWLGFLCIGLILSQRLRIDWLLPTIATIPLAVVALLPSNSGPWKSIWQQLSGFDERNFNTAILAEPRLLNSSCSLVRPQGNLTGRLPIPKIPTVVFGLIGESLNIGSVELGACRRIGSLKTTEGPFLMDAQSCEVSGSAEVLIGDKEGAAAVRIYTNDVPMVLIFDRNFLSQTAPSENAKWLVKILSEVEPRSSK